MVCYCMDPKHTLKRCMFGLKPKKYSSPLEKNDHPELDDSELLDEKDILTKSYHNGLW
jgi:hypothetical protein